MESPRESPDDALPTAATSIPLSARVTRQTQGIISESNERGDVQDTRTRLHRAAVPAPLQLQRKFLEPKSRRLATNAPSPSSPSITPTTATTDSSTLGVSLSQGSGTSADTEMTNFNIKTGTTVPTPTTATTASHLEEYSETEEAHPTKPTKPKAKFNIGDKAILRGYTIYTVEREMLVSIKDKDLNKVVDSRHPFWEYRVEAVEHATTTGEGELSDEQKFNRTYSFDWFNQDKLRRDRIA